MLLTVLSSQSEDDLRSRRQRFRQLAERDFVETIPQSEQRISFGTQTDYRENEVQVTRGLGSILKMHLLYYRRIKLKRTESFENLITYQSFIWVKEMAIGCFFCRNSLKNYLVLFVRLKVEHFLS